MILRILPNCSIINCEMQHKMVDEKYSAMNAVFLFGRKLWS